MKLGSAGVFSAPVVRSAALLAGALCFGLALWALHEALGAYSYRDVAAALSAIPGVSLALALALALWGYVVVIGYDVLAVRFIRRAIALRRIALAAFVGSALANNIGNALVTGGPVRYWMYRPLGLTAGDVARVVVFCSAGFWLGFLGVAGIVFSVFGMEIPEVLHLPVSNTRPLGVILLAFLAVYFSIAAAKRRSLGGFSWSAVVPPVRLAAGQLCVGTLDLLTMGTTVYLLLPHDGLPYAVWLPIFLLALVAGAASQVPGGLGVFEAVVLLLIPPDVPPPQAAAGLLAFRFIYSFLPLAIATAVVTLRYLPRRRGWLRHARGDIGARDRPRQQSLIPLAATGDIERAAPIVERSQWTYANLVYRRDKALIFSDGGEGFLMYGRTRRTFVAMGDPIGPPQASRGLVARFCKLCRSTRTRPVFFEVRDDGEGIYRDHGLTLTKLGEEARVELASFDLHTHAHAHLRQAHARVLRHGCTFEIVPKERVPGLVPELLRVSESWLAAKSTAEKGFSNASFDGEYMGRFPAAVVRRGEAVIAFANLWLGAQKEELSVDLMRHVSDAPGGTMDFLFTEILLWGASSGYRWFNFGVAPLSGLGTGDEVTLWERAGTLLYRHGEHFYNFRGLRHYKDKFGPVWTPRYLASPGGLALPLVLLDVAALIAGGVGAIVAGGRRHRR